MPMFENKWIVVSGASSGIGRAIAIELVRQGARLVLLGRNAEKLTETARLANSAAPSSASSPRTEEIVLDLAQLDGIAPAMAAAAARIGPIYGLCHCAGVVQTLPLAATRPERAAAMLNVNLIAGLELARAVTRRDTVEPTGGSILWMASIYAHVGAPGQIGYCATKGAVLAAARAMALELAPRHVRVNTISPGLVRTAMTDSGNSRLSPDQWAQIAAKHPLGTGAPEDVARAAAFLLAPENKWITGADLIIDGGYTLQ